MKVTTCTINVGNGEGNRNMVFEALWFVDVFIILDCPTNGKGGYLEHENSEYEMVSSVENGDVEVYIRTSMVGWFTIESHEKEAVIIRYQEEETDITKRIGAIYVRPLRESAEIEKRMEEMKSCDIIVGDLNARNRICGKEAGDEWTNAYGRKLHQWMMKNEREVAKNYEKTFRQTSVIDITIYKKGDKPPSRQLTDKCSFEHMGQIIRLKVEKPTNLRKENVNWKKIDWDKLEKDLKKIRIEEDGGWGDLKSIMVNLPKKKCGKKGNKWWTENLEKMARDTRKMRREGNEGWKTARKVLRNMMIKGRYECMKEELGSLKDPTIFKAIKELEGRRAIPPITKADGSKVYEHEK